MIAVGFLRDMRCGAVGQSQSGVWISSVRGSQTVLKSPEVQPVTTNGQWMVSLKFQSREHSFRGQPAAGYRVSWWYSRLEREREREHFADVYFMAGSAFDHSRQYIVWSGGQNVLETWVKLQGFLWRIYWKNIKSYHSLPKTRHSKTPALYSSAFCNLINKLVI